MPKLPARLAEQQKRRELNNLLQELRRSGSIDNRGTRAQPQWLPAETDSDEDSP